VIKTKDDDDEINPLAKSTRPNPYMMVFPKKSEE
jgi:hypothetical protein